MTLDRSNLDTASLSDVLHALGFPHQVEAAIVSPIEAGGSRLRALNLHSRLGRAAALKAKLKAAQ